MALSKTNFIVNFSNTMQSWEGLSDPYTDNAAQASPAARCPDRLRRDFGSLWMPKGPTADDMRWTFGARLYWPGAPATPSDFSLIENYTEKTLMGTSDAVGPEHDRHPASEVVGRSSRLVPPSHHAAHGSRHAGYGGGAPYGFIRQQIRIEARRSLLPHGGATWDAGDMPVTYDDAYYSADVDAWINWCISNYYGRYASGPDRGFFKRYVDHATSYDSPYTPLEQQADPTRTAATTEFNYNFYIKEYERLTSRLAPNTHTIYPHLYTMFFEKSRDLGLEGATDPSRFAMRVWHGAAYDINNLYNDFVTLDRSIPYVFTNTMRTERFDSFAGVPHSIERVEKAGERDRGEYFDRWTRSYKRVYNGEEYASSRPGIEAIQAKYKNIIFTKMAAAEAGTYNPYKELFPMYSEVSIPLFNDRGDGLGYTVPSSWGVPLAGPNLATANVVTRAWDGFHALEHGALSSPYTYMVNFAENHQKGDLALATGDNIEGGTQRKVFDLGELIDELGEDASNPGSNIVFVDDSVSFKSALGATSTADPEGYGFIIETNDEEEADESLIADPLLDSLGFGNFVDSIDEQLVQLAQNFLRSYTEILEGGEAFSTPLFYKINKYERLSSGDRGALLQSFIVPQYTSAKSAFFNMIDTQLRYDNSYEYEVLTYQVVVGSQYRFTELYVPHAENHLGLGVRLDGSRRFYGPAVHQLAWRDEVGDDGIRNVVREPGQYPPGPGFAPMATEIPQLGGSEEDEEALETPYLEGTGNPFFAELDVVIEPSFAIVELPYIEISSPWMPASDTSFGIGTILDSPGMPPNVNVIPYRGVNDKLLFNLSTGAGTQLAAPIALDAGEEQYYTRLRESYGYPSAQIKYQSDDPASSFEIYRLDSLPANYQEFSNRRIAKLATENRLIGYRKASSVSYVDTISPNRKYYYMFRSIDVHGHASLATEIYEVELTDDDGAVYPQVRIVDMSDQQVSKTSLKKMRRFLQIRPQIAQRLFNAEATFEPLDQDIGSSAPITNDIVLGYPPEKPWGRTFKIRLTSKTTGKKADLNVRFKKEYVDQRSDGTETGDGG